MASFEQITIVGHLGSDPNLRYTPDGRPLTSLSVATSRKYKDDHNGEYNTQSTWFNVLVGGPQAEFMANNAAKGNQVLVVGKFMPDRETGRPKVWTTKAGESAASYDVLADMVRVLERKSNAGPSETDYNDSIPF